MVQATVGGSGGQAQLAVSELMVNNDVDIELGDLSDAIIRLSTANTGGGGTFAAQDLVFGLDDASQSLHITDKAAIATDWALDDTTHPIVYIHSNTTPATDYISIGNHDGTTADIDVQGGTTLTLSIAGTPQATVTAAVLNIPSGNTYQINATDVLTATALGSGVVGSSLTSLGVQGEDLDMGGFDIDNAGFVILNAATAPADTEVYLLNDNTGDLTLNALSGKNIFLAIAGSDAVTVSNTLLHISGSNAGGNVQLRVSNTENTNAASNSRLLVFAGGASGGDPYLEFQISGAETLTMGLDNSNSDNFAMSDGSLGGSDRLRLVVTTGVLSVDGDGGGADDPVSLFDDYDDVMELQRYTHSTLDIPDMFISREQRLANRQRMVEMGVAEWAEQHGDGPDRLMIRVQPMTKLMAGGIYQNRVRMDAYYEDLDRRLQALERAA